ncbi:hypothetical protein [Actibacterium sp. D379-3]
MQVVYHLGAHSTDEDRLRKCLLKNKGILAEEGIIVPGPARYRPILRETMLSLRGQPAPAETQEMLLDAVMDEDHAERVIFSNQTFLCSAARVLRDGRLYSQAGERSFWMSQIFPDAECEFYLGLRNPATFLPAVYTGCTDVPFDEFLSGADPRALRWSEVVRAIRDANPQATLTVWCNEDTPLIWPELLREVSGHDPFTTLAGTDDFLSSIMSKTGMKRMNDYLDGHPPANEIQRRRVVAAFLDKFAIEDEIEMELDLPGWTEDLVEEMTELYEEDMFEIERMQGVHFITP